MAVEDGAVGEALVRDMLGIADRKPPRPPTGEEKLVATMRRKATRVARHTASPQQKAKLRGDATVHVSVEPSPASPTRSPA